MSPETQEKEKTLVTKMSVRGIGCKPQGTNPPTPLCVIYGKATDIQTGENKRDGTIWSALIGSFEAVNLQNGNVYKSGKLFLPGGIHETVEHAVHVLKTANNSDGSAIAIEFALEIRSVEASNPIGYSYQAVSMQPARATDELEPLRQAIKDARQKRLAAAQGIPQIQPPAALDELANAIIQRIPETSAVSETAKAGKKK